MIGKKLGDAIYAILTTNAGVTAALSTRIYPNIVPQKAAFPAAFYMTESVKPMPCRQPNGRFSGTFQVGVLAEDYLDAQNGIDAIRAVFDDYEGVAATAVIRTGTGTQLPPDYDDVLKIHQLTIEYAVSGKVS